MKSVFISENLYFLHIMSLVPVCWKKFMKKVLVYELQNNGLKVKTQVPMNIKYKDTCIESGFIADIIVEDKVIIEIKAVTEINNIHHQQLLTYLKLTDLKLGILVNFNTDYIDKSIFRKINGNLD